MFCRGRSIVALFESRLTRKNFSIITARTAIEYNRYVYYTGIQYIFILTMIRCKIDEGSRRFILRCGFDFSLHGRQKENFKNSSSATMAALTRPTTASYEIHENVVVDTLGTCMETGDEARSAMDYRCHENSFESFSFSDTGSQFYLLPNREWKLRLCCHFAFVEPIF